MNKNIWIQASTGLLLVLLLLGALRWWRGARKSDTLNSKITIGILQTASHPALDAAREGFIEELKKQLGDRVVFVEQNAQGSLADAHALASRFHARSDIDALFAIATPAAKACASVETKKPIFIAAVTDPEAIGLMHPSTNVTGSSDMINVTELIAAAQELVPRAKKVGILFNIAEINSQLLVNQIETRLAQVGLESVKMGVTSETDLAGVLDAGLKKIDVLLAPTDNTVASAVTFIAERALQARKPFIVSDNLLVQQGPLAARGVDYKESGKQAANAAIQVLVRGKNPSDVPIAKPMRSRVFINKRTLDSLSLTIPKSMQPDVEFITADAKK